MNSFREALKTRDFVYTAELPLLPDSTPASIVGDAQKLAGVVDGFLLTDNQYGQPHMAPAYAAGVLRQHGLPPILQISTRNRNRIALIGELLGARSTGIDTVVLVRGAILPEGYQPRPGAVMDTDAKELIATAKLINEDFGDTDEMLIGTSATAHVPPADKRPDELIGKADAGAQLMITQICLDAGVIRRYVEFLVGHKLLRRFNLVVSVAIVTDLEIATWLRDNRWGTIVPDACHEAIAAGREAAIDQAISLVRAIREIPGIAGINFAAAGELELVPEVIAAVEGNE